MAIDRNPRLIIPVKTYTHYTECEPWCLDNVGAWNEAWWKDFQDMAMSITLGEGTQPDCYWFHREQDALMFRLKFV
jgi:hypothetical protein